VRSPALLLLLLASAGTVREVGTAATEIKASAAQAPQFRVFINLGRRARAGLMRGRWTGGRRGEGGEGWGGRLHGVDVLEW
jgi:hypothetical protein